MRERHERWMTYVKSGKLTTEQVHTCEELEVFVCAVIVFGGISPEDTVINKRAQSFSGRVSALCLSAGGSGGAVVLFQHGETYIAPSFQTFKLYSYHSIKSAQ